MPSVTGTLPKRPGPPAFYNHESGPPVADLLHIKSLDN